MTTYDNSNHFNQDDTTTSTRQQLMAKQLADAKTAGIDPQCLSETDLLRLQLAQQKLTAAQQDFRLFTINLFRKYDLADSDSVSAEDGSITRK